MLRRSLPASGTSRNQNTAADRDATISRLPAWSGGRDGPCTGHPPTPTSDVVMRAPWHSFWFQLGSHVVEPHGNPQEGRFMSHASSHDRYVDVGEWSGYPLVANVAWSCEFEHHSDLYAHHDRPFEGRARRNASCQTRRPAVATNASSSTSTAIGLNSA